MEWNPMHNQHFAFTPDEALVSEFLPVVDEKFHSDSEILQLFGDPVLIC